MTIDDQKNISEFTSLFGKPGYRIRGIGTGSIIRYRDFYLKIYDNENGCSYTIQGYRYNGQSPYFVDTVPYERMREYAEQFKDCP